MVIPSPVFPYSDSYITSFHHIQVPLMSCCFGNNITFNHQHVISNTLIYLQHTPDVHAIVRITAQAVLLYSTALMQTF